MINVHNGMVTVEESGKTHINAVYDKDLKMTRLSILVGQSTVEAWLPAHRLAELLSEVLETVRQDPGAIGFDTDAARTNRRLAHLVSVK